MYTSLTLYVFFQVCALPLSYACVIDESLLDKKPHLLFEESSEIISSKLGDIIYMDTGYYDPKCIKYTINKPNRETLDLNVNNTVIFKSTEFNKNENLVNNSASEMNESRIHDIGKTHTYEQLKVGPLKEDDHGNWLFTKYFVDKNCTITEIFKTVTIEVIETIEPTHKRITIEEGGVLNISLPRSVQNVEMCELIRPAATPDRYFDRDMEKPLNYCGYTIPNFTKEDQGLWQIIAVGKIVYRTSVYVSISKTSFVNNLGIICRILPWCSLSAFLQ